MRRKTKLKSLLAVSAVVVLAIVGQAAALKYPHDSPSFAGCENSGYVFWEFTDDGCMPTSDEFDPPYDYAPPLADPTFGSRHWDDPTPGSGWGGGYGGELWTWSDGVFTVLSEDAITQSIPERGSKQYLRQYFEVVHTLVPGLPQSDNRWPIGFSVEIWDLSGLGWTGCPQGYETGSGYLGGYEDIPPEIHYEIPGAPGWYKSIWVHDFSMDGVFGPQDGFNDLFDATHTACIVGMDLDPESGEIFQIEEVVIDFIWFDDPCGNDIPTEPAGSIIGQTSVEIEPLQPSSSDEIAITLSGQWSNSCIPSNSFVWIDGDTINFEVIPNNSVCRGCFLAITPWELTDYVGPLSSGSYTVYAYMYKDPNNLIADPYTFVVSDNYYVDAVDGNDLNDGRSWATAFATIQKGIDTAENCDKVLVADGMYTGPGNRDIDFLGKAITVRSENGPENCIIDCGGAWQVSHRGFYFHQNEGADSILQGFTIRNGEICFDEDLGPEYYDFPPYDPWEKRADHPIGGGIYCELASPTITNCVISNCGTELGGGIGCVGGAPVIINCTIDDCGAGGYGWAESGGEGGGIGIMRSCYATITNCKLTNNTDYYNSYGGGIYCIDSEAEISGCTISGNSAFGSVDGAGLYCGPLSYVTIKNSLITENTAEDGGGVFCSDGSDVTLTNCTLSGNSVDYNGGGIFCETPNDVIVTNCILWGNTAPSAAQIYGSATVSYSDVQGGWLGEGNIDANPLFVDAPSSDYHLSVDSPCIDVGDNSVVDYDTDLDGNPRIVNYVVDMGAYEFQSIIYVDTDATGADDGSSWADAYTSLPYALDIASFGDEIWVAQGTYRPNDGIVSIPEVDDRELTFQLKSDVSVKGGYAGYGEPAPDARDVDAYETILSGDLSGNDVGNLDDPSRDDNSYHVVTGSGTDETAVLDGFTVTSGNAGDSSEPHNNGGGMYNDSSSPTVINCIFTGNLAIWAGAGMYNESNSSPTVTGCTFTGNSAYSDVSGGGGMYNLDSSSPTVTGCTFSGNSADIGGGMFNNHNSSPMVTNSTFTGNSANYYGGGIFNMDSSSLTMVNCTFTGNSAEYFGGGMFNQVNSSPTVTNCTFGGNSAEYNGGGMYNEWDSSPTVTNCILWGNTAPEGNEIYNDMSAPAISYCDIAGCGGSGAGWITFPFLGIDGGGNIDADPLFIDADGADNTPGTEDDNLRLQADSACINAGDNSVVDPNSTDLDGNPRIVSYTVDMGAYEFEGIIYVDDDASGDPGPGDPNISDLLENGTWAHPFDEIQEGIDAAHDGDTVVVHQGLYLGQYPAVAEEINFLGKNITLTSTDPTDPNMTVIRGTVQFDGTENSSCTLTGFRIHDLGFGAIYGNGTHATISHCILSGNGPCSATVIENCDGTISNCLITDNTTVFLCGVYPVIFGCHGVIKNCTIANNASGISILDGAEATIENCIIYHNDESFTPQLSVGAGGALNISYCDVQGGLGGISGAGTVNPGPGNIDTDPCFAQLGYWQDPFELVEGDYHLKSEGWRWRGILAHGSFWTYDYVTSRCIDAANPGSPLLDEVMTVLPDDPDNEWGENVRRNMGVYGGTAEASMPPYGWALLADLTNDGIVNLSGISC